MRSSPPSPPEDRNAAGASHRYAVPEEINNNTNNIMTQSKIVAIVDAYAQANAAAKIAAEAADAAKAKILALGDGTYLGTAHKVVVSTSIPVRFDSSAFKAAEPELYEQFKKQGDPVTSARIHGR